MPSTDKPLCVRFLGKSVAYDDAMARMREAMARVDDQFENGGGFQLILLEHKDVITTTRQHGARSLIKPVEEIKANGIDIIETDRGGDVTFHGLGQLVGYLVLRLEPVDLNGYVRSLEHALLDATRALGIAGATTIEGKTGVWVSSPGCVPRKLIAIGVGVSRGVTRHGFALNVTTDLERFTDCIVPCGLEGFGVTSLELELCKVPSASVICETIVAKLKEAFRLKPDYEKNFSPELSSKTSG